MPPPTQINFDIEAGQSANTYGVNKVTDYKSASIRSGPEVPQVSSPVLKRRQTRVNTNFTTVDITPARPSWRPGQEPGLDPSKPNGGRLEEPTRREDCQITVVDYSENDIVIHDFNNAELIQFLGKEQESWISCRWVNVNGLSWDVIQALGKTKGLHRLAIEDLMNTNNRTKVDWYAIWLQK
jgi:Mg2+ and Co2+ transporter CorA